MMNTILSFGIILLLITGGIYYINPNSIFKLIYDDKAVWYNATKIDGYTFYFIENCFIEDNASECIGFTDEHKHIWINQTDDYHTLKVVCNHEICHNILVEPNATLEEEYCIRIGKILGSPTCEKLLNKIFE